MTPYQQSAYIQMISGSNPDTLNFDTMEDYLNWKSKHGPR